MTEPSPSELALGANIVADSSCSFLVWAPWAKDVTLQIEGPRPRQIQMNVMEKGYFHCFAPAVPAQTRYFYLLDGSEKRPDPASRYQPEGVHGPSQVCCNSFEWNDLSWSGLPLTDAVFYELHVGTFTPEGTFDAIIDRLPSLKSLGITLIELMPIAQFSGNRNWGYDGVYPYAVQNSYGGPDALKRLVNACHQAGIGMALDVVYNHLGPEGNYLSDFGPYFTDRYKTPWGDAVNFDDAYSDEVRRFFIENALYWITEFHVDALRLDAIHAIVDLSAKLFLEDLTERVAELSLRLGRKVHIIAENDRNDARSLAPREAGGFGLDSQWNDDFHHAVHALVTGERGGYYQDFGTIDHLAKACREGFLYAGQYSAFRRRRHGSSSADTPCYQFVVFSQNHDQVGNRAQGERLSQIVSFETLKLVAGVVLLSPFIPLLFMGEEYGELSPFQYFVSHEDTGLIEKVRQGRRKEFERFAWRGDIPDPASPDTFMHSKLHWEEREHGQHRTLLLFYTELLRLRRAIPALSNPSKTTSRVTIFEPDTLIVERWHEQDRIVIFYNFEADPISVHCSFPPGMWEKQLESSDEKWAGPRSSTPSSLQASNQVSLDVQGRSFVLFRLTQGGAD
ncbi:MAG: malto-oligosyltrehalose trehalohydrolase [Candidatus Acidiferrales bacterium]